MHMDCNLLAKRCHPASDEFILRQLLILRERGYSTEECRLIHKRTKRWLEENIPIDPVQGVVVPMQRDITTAIKEVLADSVDLAAKAKN